MMRHPGRWPCCLSIFSCDRDRGVLPMAASASHPQKAFRRAEDAVTGSNDLIPARQP